MIAKTRGRLGPTRSGNAGGMPGNNAKRPRKRPRRVGSGNVRNVSGTDATRWFRTPHQVFSVPLNAGTPSNRGWTLTTRNGTQRSGKPKHPTGKTWRTSLRNAPRRTALNRKRWNPQRNRINRKRSGNRRFESLRLAGWSRQSIPGDSGFFSPPESPVSSIGEASCRPNTFADAGSKSPWTLKFRTWKTGQRVQNAEGR